MVKPCSSAIFGSAPAGFHSFCLIADGQGPIERKSRQSTCAGQAIQQRHASSARSTHSALHLGARLLSVRPQRGHPRHDQHNGSGLRRRASRVPLCRGRIPAPKRGSDWAVKITSALPPQACVRPRIARLHHDRMSLDGDAARSAVPDAGNACPCGRCREPGRHRRRRPALARMKASSSQLSHRP